MPAFPVDIGTIAEEHGASAARHRRARRSRRSSWARTTTRSRGPRRSTSPSPTPGPPTSPTARRSATVRALCSRCLADFDLPLEGEVDVYFVVPAHADEVPEEQDFALVDDGRVDLGPFVESALAVAIPLAPLCDEECAGICPVCGADLNEETCECETPARRASVLGAAGRLGQPASARVRDVRGGRRLVAHPVRGGDGGVRHCRPRPRAGLRDALGAVLVPWLAAVGRDDAGLGAVTTYWYRLESGAWKLRGEAKATFPTARPSRASLLGCDELDRHGDMAHARRLGTRGPATGLVADVGPGVGQVRLGCDRLDPRPCPHDSGEDVVSRRFTADGRRDRPAPRLHDRQVARVRLRVR